MYECVPTDTYYIIYMNVFTLPIHIISYTSIYLFICEMLSSERSERTSYRENLLFLPDLGEIRDESTD